MKNLHKKIGAMVLAGMVVFGGVAVSGVNSFAASGSKIVPSNNIEELQKRKVGNIIRDYGNILLVDKDQKKIDEFVKENHSNIGRKYQNRCRENVRNPYKIPMSLQIAKRYGKEIVKIQYQDFYYLIQVK